MTAEQIIIWSIIAVLILAIVFKVTWDVSKKEYCDSFSDNWGVDIYIDDKNKIMYVSLNESVSTEALQRIRESLKNCKTYEIVVMEEINNINFLNNT